MRGDRDVQAGTCRPIRVSKVQGIRGTEVPSLVQGRSPVIGDLVDEVHRSMLNASISHKLYAFKITFELHIVGSE